MKQKKTKKGKNVTRIVIPKGAGFKRWTMEMKNPPQYPTTKKPLD